MALILCIFIGFLGAHRFYVNKIGTGVLYLCTEGLFGIGVLVDFIMILVGSFTDDAGLPLVEWDGYKPAPVMGTTYQQPYQQPYQQTYAQPPPYPASQQPQSKTKYCPICGSANELASTYCSSCGSALES
ncbi:MAG: TM2 domain-containing protein [Asgard group archaeon]|nr:TM2 domain-containing protein [Asgard group archaeon]